MPKRTDLSAYKKPKPAVTETRVLTPANAAPRPVKKTQIGRPKKKVEEKRDQKVTLSFTKAERDRIEEQAGLVPAATFLFNKLRDTGVLD